MVKQFRGQVKVADIQEAFENLLDKINNAIDIYNNTIDTIASIDPTKGTDVIPGLNYTLTVGALKKILRMYCGELPDATVSTGAKTDYIKIGSRFFKAGAGKGVSTKGIIFSQLNQKPEVVPGVSFSVGDSNRSLYLGNTGEIATAPKDTWDTVTLLTSLFPQRENGVIDDFNRDVINIEGLALKTNAPGYDDANWWPFSRAPLDQGKDNIISIAIQPDRKTGRQGYRGDTYIDWGDHGLQLAHAFFSGGGNKSDMDGAWLTRLYLPNSNYPFYGEDRGTTYGFWIENTDK